MLLVLFFGWNSIPALFLRNLTWPRCALGEGCVCGFTLIFFSHDCFKEVLISDKQRNSEIVHHLVAFSLLSSLFWRISYHPPSSTVFYLINSFSINKRKHNGSRKIIDIAKKTFAYVSTSSFSFSGPPSTPLLQLQQLNASFEEN